LGSFPQTPFEWLGRRARKPPDRPGKRRQVNDSWSCADPGSWTQFPGSAEDDSVHPHVTTVPQGSPLLRSPGALPSLGTRLAWWPNRSSVKHASQGRWTTSRSPGSRSLSA